MQERISMPAMKTLLVLARVMIGIGNMTISAPAKTKTLKSPEKCKCFFFLLSIYNFLRKNAQQQFVIQ